MADFKGIEHRLNSDPKYRAAFLSDPVSTLLGAGIVMSVENAELLRHRVGALQNKSSAVAGSAVRSPALGGLQTFTATNQLVGSTAGGPGQAPGIRLMCLVG